MNSLSTLLKQMPSGALFCSVLLLAVCTLFPLSASADAALDAQFNQANIHFQNEEYQQAIQLFETILQTEQSANLHYNLANTYFQIEAHGKAILHYRKALALEPGNPEFEANLKFALEAAQITHPDPTWLDRYSQILSVNTWTWLCAIAFWSSVALIILPKLYQWRGIMPWVTFSFTTGLLGLGLLALAGYHFQSNQGIVISEDAPIKVAPTDTVEPNAYLADGELSTIDDEHLPYYLVTTTAGQSGWIHQDHFQKIWAD